MSNDQYQLMLLDMYNTFHQKSLMWYKKHKINKIFKVIKLEQIIHPIIDPFHINSGMYHM